MIKPLNQKVIFSIGDRIISKEEAKEHVKKLIERRK